jgi:hypothetical protein
MIIDLILKITLIVLFYYDNIFLYKSKKINFIKMKVYIFVLLIVFIFTEHPYQSTIGNIVIEKSLYAKDKNRTVYLEKVSQLDIPDEAKEWVKNIRYSGKEFKYNIFNLTYDPLSGGFAQGEILYFYKDSGSYNFIYGIGSVELRKLQKYLKSYCKRPMPILPLKCDYHWTEPSYEKTTFKKYLGERIRNKLILAKK